MNSTNGLGNCLIGLGEIEQGLLLLRTTCEMSTQVLGARHPSTLHFLQTLESAEKTAGESNFSPLRRLPLRQEQETAEMS